MRRKKNRSDGKRLNKAINSAIKLFAPPENLKVSEWAEKCRMLPPTSAEPGRWKNSRTPYLVEPMDAFNDPKVHRIVVVASSQVGKSELELNIIGYIIDQDPGSILYVQPTIDDAKKFSRLRIAPMIQESKSLKSKVADVKAKDSGNTILQKAFPAGMLTITGSNSPSALASTPARYIIGDERDRWALSAGDEGDPWALAEARQATFYNAKSIEVSTPTIKGRSNIENAFYLGTQEKWCHCCLHCGEWSNIEFGNIVFEHKTYEINGKKSYKINEINWRCPKCGGISSEREARKQPAKWIAENPDAYQNGIRSFWLNAFSSPWVSWEKIIRKFLEAQGSTLQLQTVYNTILGQLWEDRGEIQDEETLLSRRESYTAELPDGVLVLTCGVDTQDNRLEYEVVGFGRLKESWGIKKGVIPGRADEPEVWERLDDVVEHVYHFADGRGLTISVTFVDSGGNKTQDVYKACKARQNKKVFPIKGRAGDSIPFVSPASKVKIIENGRAIGNCWFYSLGVDSGKAAIMAALKVQTPGAPQYCHFPVNEDLGYDYRYFNGLLSEKFCLIQHNKKERWGWVKLVGHSNNEPLDCRNYANAAFRMMDLDMEAVANRFKNPSVIKKRPPPKPQQQKNDLFGGW